METVIESVAGYWELIAGSSTAAALAWAIHKFELIKTLRDRYNSAAEAIEVWWRLPKEVQEIKASIANQSAPVMAPGRFFCQSCGNIMRIVKTEPYVLEYMGITDDSCEWAYLQCGNQNCFRHLNHWRVKVDGATAR